MIAIYKREIRAYFFTPIGFLFMGFFLLISGIFFAAGHLLSGNSYYSGFLGNLLMVYVFAVPILTMRLFAEEKRQKTDQLLLTSPVSIFEIVCGKFLAAFTVYAITVIITFLYAVVVSVYGTLMWAETIGSYIGFLFLGAGYIAVGVFVSAKTENQLTAALTTFFCLFVILFIEPISRMVPVDIRSGLISAGILALFIAFFVFINTRNWVITLGIIIVCALVIMGLWFLHREIYFGFIRKLLGWFSLNRRYQPFTLGLLKIDALVYYASFSALFLFLTVRTIEKRRWS